MHAQWTPSALPTTEPKIGTSRQPMTFQSILFPNPDEAADEDAEEQTVDEAAEEQAARPEFFADLNLDQIVAAITAGRQEYDLTDFFHMPLVEADDIEFRQEVMRDLEGAQLTSALRRFADAMRAVRESLVQAKKPTYKAEKERWFVDAAELYCEAVTCLAGDLSDAPIASRGLSFFKEFATEYAESERFQWHLEQVKQVKAELGSIRYDLLISRLRVEVLSFEEGPEYSAEIEDLFERFRQGDVEPFSFKISQSDSLSKVESMILDLVAKRHPEVFARLEAFCLRHKNFINQTIVDFDREIQFYVAYLEHIERLRRAGLKFCYPSVSRDSKESYSIGGFDLALADTQVGEDRTIVCNDFQLNGAERIVVVTGPNQGGKTTFARAFGQTHYLASLGCPVPGSKAQLPICDKILTHFEKQEDIADLSGKLKDDLMRVRSILDEATPRSLIVVNEIFSSTSLRDASVLSRNIAARLIELDLLCLWVTFVDELASFGEQTVSMVSTVEPGSPANRTFRIVRRPADGLAYALSIAEKHRLTRDMIGKRLSS